MRKIDWEQKLSDEDIFWLRTTGQPGMEERIKAHQAQFDADVPEEDIPEDTVTRSALDPTARTGERAVFGDGPLLVDPTAGNGVKADESEDYANWKVSELQDEIKARNEMPNTSNVVIEPSGDGGKTLKKDLANGLRAWDKENPNAFKD